jgi:hypothetical protein
MQKGRTRMIRCEAAHAVTEREPREENEALKRNVAHLQAALDVMQGRDVVMDTFKSVTQLDVAR